MLLQEFLEETHDITPEELVWVFKVSAGPKSHRSRRELENEASSAK